MYYNYYFLPLFVVLSSLLSFSIFCCLIKLNRTLLKPMKYFQSLIKLFTFSNKQLQYKISQNKSHKFITVQVQLYILLFVQLLFFYYVFFKLVSKKVGIKQSYYLENKCQKCIKYNILTSKTKINLNLKFLSILEKSFASPKFFYINIEKKV